MEYHLHHLYIYLEYLASPLINHHLQSTTLTVILMSENLHWQIKLSVVGMTVCFPPTSPAWHVKPIWRWQYLSVKWWTSDCYISSIFMTVLIYVAIAMYNLVIYCWSIWHSMTTFQASYTFDKLTPYNYNVNCDIYYQATSPPYQWL